VNQAHVHELNIKGWTYCERKGRGGGNVDRRQRLSENLEPNKVKSRVATGRVETYEFARVETDSTLADRGEDRRQAVVNPIHFAGLTTRARGRLNGVGDLVSGQAT
jgi:hypothetical protein